MDETGSKSMDLSQVRSEIDRVDSDILRLFIERMELAERAAQAKQAAGLPLQNRAREREILTRAYEAARERGMGIYAHRLFTSLIELSRAYQSDILAGSQQSAVRSLI
ncbi:MAG TPA: chorismate mutase, partial [Bacillota bacterium]|nr:chorismate mutase [Bacillota bacterium]